jgi:large subunit ribosomal protein L1
MAVLIHSKRYRSGESLVNRRKSYLLPGAIAVLKQFPKTKFDETVELNFQLSVDLKASDAIIRTTVSLPNGTGKKVTVLCFCKGEGANDARQAGADYVGAEDLIEKIQGGWFDFDVVVAHPDMMRDISKLGRVLGPKGLMPSPKTGTVTMQVGKAVQEVKKGKIELKSDKTGGLHVPCGKLSFTAEALQENARAVVKTVLDAKPSSAKGDYLRSVTISTTHGPGLRLQVSSILK